MKTPGTTAEAWNAMHPVGTPVLAWPDTRDAAPMVTRTRTPAWTLGHGEAVVSVDGHAGGIALTHIEPRSDEPTAAIEWTGDNIDAVMAFMTPDEPIHVNSLSHLRFTNADELVGVSTPDGLKIAKIGDLIARVGDHFTVRPRGAEEA